MAPKKKGSKKQADDWEADLGETIDPIAQAAADAQKEEADQNGDADGEVNGGGGLLAALRKNKEKRAKKGKPVINDFVEGEDADSAAPTPPTADLDSKAPTEATFDDNEEDVFASNVKKGKGSKKQQGSAAADEDDADEGGAVKSKKEKEREKREREKQRKKEQVSHARPQMQMSLSRLTNSRRQRKRRLLPHQRPSPNKPNLWWKKSLNQQPQKKMRKAARRRRFRHTSQPSKSSRRHLPEQERSRPG